MEEHSEQSVNQNSGTKIAKFLTVVGSLTAVGFVAITTYQNADATRTISTKSTNLSSGDAKLKSRASVPVYGEMDEDSRSGLFSEFSDKFQRKVGLTISLNLKPHSFNILFYLVQN